MVNTTVVSVQIRYYTSDILELTYRFDDEHQRGPVKSVGQSSIARVSKSGLFIPLEKGQYGDVLDVRRRVKLSQLNIDAGVAKLRILRWTNWQRHIAVVNPV